MQLHLPSYWYYKLYTYKQINVFSLSIFYFSLKWYFFISDISDNSNDSYTIDDVTGDLIVNVSGYDREEEPFITLTVVARDEGGKETSARVNITVLDQNDNDPKFLEDFQFEVYQVGSIESWASVTDNVILKKLFPYTSNVCLWIKRALKNWFKIIN